jgi:threonine synthase
LFAIDLKCTSCGQVHELNERVLVCSKCGSILDVQYDLDSARRSFTRESLRPQMRSVWRYRELLPVSEDKCIVSLGEGITPLKRTTNYGGTMDIADLTLKLDFLNPTGSFKDRGTTVTVSKLNQQNIDAVMDDSSGNAGLSLAAYCASARIKCTLYVPSSIPDEKLVQARIYGAKIEKISGSRTDVANAAEKRWKESGLYYASHNLSPFFFEGMKTLAYELCEALDWKTPHHIVFPVGGGTLLAGTWKGFNELITLGWIATVPRIHCVQSDACMPIVQAYQKGSSEVEPVTERETVAGGIRISNPARGWQVLEALRATRGKAISVSDEEILRHQRLLAEKEGIFAEPTSCAALAGLEKLRKTGEIKADESVIVPLTGFGLKDTKSAAKSLESLN